MLTARLLENNATGVRSGCACYEAGSTTATREGEGCTQSTQWGDDGVDVAARTAHTHRLCTARRLFGVLRPPPSKSALALERGSINQVSGPHR